MSQALQLDAVVHDGVAYAWPNGAKGARLVTRIVANTVLTLRAISAAGVTSQSVKVRVVR